MTQPIHQAICSLWIHYQSIPQCSQIDDTLIGDAIGRLRELAIHPQLFIHIIRDSKIKFLSGCIDLNLRRSNMIPRSLNILISKSLYDCCILCSKLHSSNTIKHTRKRHTCEIYWHLQHHPRSS